MSVQRLRASRECRPSTRAYKRAASTADGNCAGYLHVCMLSKTNGVRNQAQKHGQSNLGSRSIGVVHEVAMRNYGVCVSFVFLPANSKCLILFFCFDQAQLNPPRVFQTTFKGSSYNSFRCHVTCAYVYHVARVSQSTTSTLVHMLINVHVYCTYMPCSTKQTRTLSRPVHIACTVMQDGLSAWRTPARLSMVSCSSVKSCLCFMPAVLPHHVSATSCPFPF